MAKVYYEKTTTEKLMEGAIAGLIGGAIVAVLMVLVDVVTPDRSWWSTISIMGQLFSSPKDTNTTAPDASLLVGIIVHFVMFALMGIGLVYYLPIFRRFKLHLILGGAIYGLVIWIVLYISFFNAFVTNFGGRENEIALLIASILAGAAMGWWLSRQPAGSRSAPTSPPMTNDALREE